MHARDATLASIWDAFGCDQTRQPVVLTTPGYGYHVYLPLCRGEGASERTWPAAWIRERIEHRLNQRGLDLRPGRLELFPSGVRLRAPCGAGSALVVPARPDVSDDLRLELVHARRVMRRVPGADELKRTLVREVAPMVQAFCRSMEAARRPLDEWLDEPESTWHAQWGPWGARKTVVEPKNQTLGDKGEVRCPNIKKKYSGPGTGPPLSRERLLPPDGADGASAGHRGLGEPGLRATSIPGGLLHGVEFSARIRELTESGLTEAGERHDAALKLTWYWAVVRRLGKDQVVERVREWLETFPHVSTTRQTSPVAFMRQTLREVAHYYETRCVPCQGGNARGVDTVALRPLTEADRTAILPKIAPEVRGEAETILRFLRTQADAAGCVAAELSLSATRLSTLCGERRVMRADGTRTRASKVAVRELIELGVLALHTNYSTGHHGRLYTCWYVFGSGVLPTENEAGELVLAEKNIEEGPLRVIATEGLPRVACESEAAGDCQHGEPWWVRMYQRRAFTPAEFLEGDARTLLPGPFRHRYPERTPIVAASQRSAVVVANDKSAVAAPSLSPPRVRDSLANDQSAVAAPSLSPPRVRDSLALAIEQAWQAWNASG